MTNKPPYQVWNEAVEMTGFGQKAAAQDGAKHLKRLRGELGDAFDADFRLRMITCRANSLEQLLRDWVNERTRIGI